MSRVFSTCPNCKAEVTVCSVEGDRVSPSFHVKADCPQCGKSLDVYAVNATVVPENIHGL
jgi:endogenous inhibitor of DNA gyrase (YacG/DUF329 family)